MADPTTLDPIGQDLLQGSVDHGTAVTRNLHTHHVENVNGYKDRLLRALLITSSQYDIFDAKRDGLPRTEATKPGEQAGHKRLIETAYTLIVDPNSKPALAFLGAMDPHEKQAVTALQNVLRSAVAAAPDDGSPATQKAHHAGIYIRQVIEDVNHASPDQLAHLAQRAGMMTNFHNYGYETDGINGATNKLLMGDLITDTHQQTLVADQVGALPDSRPASSAPVATASRNSASLVGGGPPPSRHNVSTGALPVSTPHHQGTDSGVGRKPRNTNGLRTAQVHAVTNDCAPSAWDADRHMVTGHYSAGQKTLADGTVDNTIGRLVADIQARRQAGQPVTSITVEGVASHDGDPNTNATLAANRALDFRDRLNRQLAAAHITDVAVSMTSRVSDQAGPANRYATARIDGLSDVQPTPDASVVPTATPNPSTPPVTAGAESTQSFTLDAKTKASLKTFVQQHMDSEHIDISMNLAGKISGAQLDQTEGAFKTYVQNDLGYKGRVSLNDPSSVGPDVDRVTFKVPTANASIGLASSTPTRRPAPHI